MRAFAEWVSSRRYRSALIAAVLGLFLPLAIPSIGVIALVALRHGSREGLLVALSATFFLALPRMLTGGGAILALAVISGLWLLAVGAVELLRRSGSLSWCLQSAVIGVSVLALALFAIGDPVGVMRTLLEALRPQLENAFQTQLGDEAMMGLAQGVTVVFFGSLFGALSAGLLLGRWWHGLLEGGATFAAEFRQLRMSRVLAIVTVILIALYLLTRATTLESMLCVLGLGFVLQGLAVMHSAAAAQGLNVGWLVALYVALVATALYAALVIGLVGWLDTWLDLRARLQRRPESG